jgi:predicted ABC-type ATPase
VLRELDRLAAVRLDFGFETTFSGLTYVRRIKLWQRAGYGVEMVYLRLRSAQFSRSWENFQHVYRPLANSWAVYDNSGRAPRFLEKGP